MSEHVVIVPLYEYGDWVDHELPREIAKPAVRDMIKQMSDEPIDWLVIGLTRHQLEELAALVRVEMRERAHAPNQPTEAHDVLKLLGDV